MVLLSERVAFRMKKTIKHSREASVVAASGDHVLLRAI